MRCHEISVTSAGVLHSCLPWCITRNEKPICTYNANISYALAALMPPNATNREKPVGSMFAVEISRCGRALCQIEMENADAEDRADAALAAIRRFLVELVERTRHPWESKACYRVRSWEQSDPYRRAGHTRFLDLTRCVLTGDQCL